MVVDEGVPAELTGTCTARTGVQHEEVPGIHRTLVEIKSPELYLWWVHKEPQEPDLVRALNLSVQASEKRSGSCTEMHRSYWLSQLIELKVNGFHKSSGSFVVDSIIFLAWCITNEYSNIGCWL
uniref:Uncharacterized protein n=1 Tax=Tanacetum cinerariifolium TaxID=118510 RepID=A0A699NVL8_TANCI|nr:hypothetical protein [Tanacetum cinerariifolium]GFC91795.1 hypothetical protein [Tanacetum cinerariifolium]